MRVLVLALVSISLGFAQTRPLLSTEVSPAKSLTASREEVVLQPVAEKSHSHARAWWIVSGVALTGASMADFSTSMGRNEANPLLANSSGQFSAGRAAGLKIGLSGVTLLVQGLLARHKPEMYVPCTVVNFAGAGAFGAAAAHNR